MLIHLNQFQFHKGRNVRLLLRMTIDPNQYCVCFRTFEEDEMEKTGMEWVECVWKRWLHEDCIECGC